MKKFVGTILLLCVGLDYYLRTNIAHSQVEPQSRIILTKEIHDSPVVPPKEIAWNEPTKQAVQSRGRRPRNVMNYRDERIRRIRMRQARFSPRTKEGRELLRMNHGSF